MKTYKRGYSLKEGHYCQNANCRKICDGEMFRLKTEDVNSCFCSPLCADEFRRLNEDLENDKQ